MKPSWPGIVVGGVIALAVFVFVLRSVRHTGSRPGEEEGGKTSESAKRGDRVEQRLQQLREAHARGAQGTEAGQIEARAGVPANPNRMKPHGAAGGADMGAGTGVGNQPNVPADGGDPGPDGDPEDIPTLKKLALEDPDPERRLTAVTLLGASEDAEAIPVLAQALSDQDEEVRLAAIQSLADFTGDAPVDALQKVVESDPSADNRYEALEVLSDIGGDRARAAIERALSDSDEDVKGLAEGILDLEQTYEPASGPVTPRAHP